MLRKPATAENVITAIVAVFLSLFLLLVVPFTTVYSVAVHSITPQSISKMTRTTIDTMVENADFEQMILDNAAVKDNIEKLGIPAETIGQLMKSGAANEVIDLLAADMLSGMFTYIINSLSVRTWILLGVSVAFIVGYILLHYLVVKKHVDAPSPTPVATTQE